MKIKIKFVLASVVFTLFLVGYGSVQQSEDLNTLLLENVEALADGEEPSYIDCYGHGSVDCPINHVKVKEVYAPYRLWH